jgi:hypothetical protein
MPSAERPISQTPSRLARRIATRVMMAVEDPALNRASCERADHLKAQSANRLRVAAHRRGGRHRAAALQLAGSGSASGVACAAERQYTVVTQSRVMFA